MAIISLTEPEDRNKDDQLTYKEKCEKYLHYLQMNIDYYTEEINEEKTDLRRKLYLGFLKYENEQARGRFYEIFGNF